MAKKKTAVPKLTGPTTAYKLLDKVCAVITEEPKRYQQEAWIRKASDVAKPPACGTVCCVAGWIETLRSSPRRTKRLAGEWRMDAGGWQIAAMASETLGLKPDETCDLFAGAALHNCPHPPGTVAYARAGVKRIRAFQKQHAAHLKSVRVTPTR